MTKNIIRLNLDLGPKIVKRIDILKNRLEAASRVEVIRRAVRLLDYTTNKRQHGSEILIRDKHGTERLLEVL